jgi:heat shock protein HtpX
MTRRTLAPLDRRQQWRHKRRNLIQTVLLLALAAAPTFVSLLQLALSRARQFEADLDAARRTGDPVGQASAVDKLERIQGGWFERILMGGARIPDPSLLRTHPTTGERIDRLVSLPPERDVVPFRAAEAVLLPSLFPEGVAHPQRRLTGLWC